MAEALFPDSTKPAKGSAVERTARNLRAMALARDDGDLLGSEEELMNIMGVSRPTLRQATGLVVQDKLLSVRRGVNGGYFVAVPDSMTVSRIAAIYLRSHEAKLASILGAVDPIRTELARTASRNRDPHVLEKLREFLARERQIEQEFYNYKTFLRAERSFGRVLGEISNNPVLTLFLAIVYDLTALVGSDQDVYVHRPDRVEAYRLQRNKMAEAILEGDEELAVIATKRCTAIVTEWMASDVSQSADSAAS
jgi:DNA-binding FadR family transcriptional regulator